MTFIDQPTETALSSWRHGALQAERLVASLLHGEGATSVDPQSPLGGPDGVKDVLLNLNGWRYVAAVYFPTTPKTFKQIATKFAKDVVGVAKNNADGIAFFTNQRLMPAKKKNLRERAKKAKVLFYDQEAIRAILDSPRGYGLRLEYLRIPMKPEEQLSFVSQFSLGLEAALKQQGELLREIAAKVGHICSSIDGKNPAVINIPNEVATGFPDRIATIATQALLRDLASPSNKRGISAKTSFVTEHLDSELLCYLHRTMLDGKTDDEIAGEFRTVGIWLGEPGSTPDRARYVPPLAKDVPKLTEALLSKWREGYEGLREASVTERFDAIVDFHYCLLQIHPFLDGNGRLARLLLEQQARELLNIDRQIVVDDSAAYNAALQAAHAGDQGDLRRILSQAVFGAWEPES